MGRLHPGSSSSSTSSAGLVDDGELELEVADAAPTASGTRRASSASASPPTRARQPVEPLHERQLAFGYTQEDLRMLLAPMAATAESRPARWATTPRSRCSPTASPSLFSYFKQRFAQVTNPAIDSVREQFVMSLGPASARRATCSTRRRARQPARARPADPHRLRARAAARIPYELFSARPSTSPGRSRGRRGPRGGSSGSAREATDALDDGHEPARPQRPRHGPERARSRRCSPVDGPPPPRARGDAPARRPRRRVRRAARGPPPRGADRLRRDRRSTRT